MEHATFLQGLFNVFLYLCIIGIVIPLFKKYSLVTANTIRRKYKLLMFLAVIVCVFPYWAGDYFNMWRDFRLAKQGESSNWESIYQWLSLILPSYTLLRLVVWGVALFLLHKFFSLIGRNDSTLGLLVILFFFAMCLPNFSYLRAATCMGMIFLGISTILLKSDGGRDIKRLLLSFALIGASFFFHKSAVIAIAIMALSLLSIHVKRFKLLIVLIILLIPFAAQYANSWLDNFIYTMPLEESSINIYAAQNYFNDQMDFGDTGPGMMVQNILTRAQYYLVVLLYVLVLIKGFYVNLPKHIKFFANFAVFTIVAANLSQVIIDIKTPVLYYRILYYSMIPCAVFLAYCHKNNLFKKISTITYYLAIIGTLYTFVYSSYNVL